MKLKETLERITNSNAARWLVKHRPLWDLLWGLPACAVALAAMIHPTDQMRATATGLVLLWLVEQGLFLRAIRRQRVHSITMQITSGTSEELAKEADRGQG